MGSKNTSAKFLGQLVGGGSQNDKGWFATELALTTAYPVGQNGWFAIVGTTDTVWIWDGDTSDRVNSGIVPTPQDFDHSHQNNLDYNSSGHTGFLGVKSRTGLATTWSTAPTLYDTQATYKVYEYTYGTTKYYRKVYNTYSPATDIFYGESGLTTVIATRALSI